MTAFMLDSVILIDHFNGMDAATDFLARHFPQCAISAITRAEVLTGFHDPEDLTAATELLDRFRFLDMTKNVADEAARQRRQSRLRLPDAIQAAFAICHDLQLVTRNSKDFAPDEFGFVVVPYELKGA